MHKNIKRLLLFVSIIQCTAFMTTAKAQSDDFGMIYEAGAEMKLSRKWNAGMEAEFRTRNNTRTADRFSIGLNTEYKIVKGLKASAGYVLLYDNNKEELEYKRDGITPKWTPSYWGVRHRFNISLSGNKDFGRLNISLRERWQHTYRPEATGKKYDGGDLAWESIKSKNKNVLRSRLQLSYDIPHWKFDPYVNTELFNSWSLEKIRYQAGVEYKYKKQHVLNISYRFQKVNNDDDDSDSSIHSICIGYKFKF